MTQISYHHLTTNNASRPSRGGARRLRPSGRVSRCFSAPSAGPVPPSMPDPGLSCTRPRVHLPPAASGEGPPSSQGAGAPVPSLASALAAQSSSLVPVPPGSGSRSGRPGALHRRADGMWACGQAALALGPLRQPGVGGPQLWGGRPEGSPLTAEAESAHLPPWGLSLPAVLRTLLLPETSAAHTLWIAGEASRGSFRGSPHLALL